MRIRRFALTLLFALMISTAAISAQCKIIYVKTNGNDANSGLSWALAKKTITGGSSSTVAGDEVWVAKGTYAGNVDLWCRGMGVYGGFLGTETARSQRDWINNETIISANQAGPAVKVPDDTTSTTVLDGFTITNGKSLNGANGGGILCNYNSSPTIANCIIKNNACYTSADLNTGGEGAGIYINNHSNPKLINVTIKDNVRYTKTGTEENGITTQLYSVATLTNCTIYDPIYIISGTQMYITGGYIYNKIRNYNTCSINGSTIIGKSTNGCLYADRGSLEIRNSTIKCCIETYGGSLSLVNNKIIGTTDPLYPNGIYLTGDCWSSSIVNNVISGCSKSGIYVDGGVPNLTIRYNTIVANGASGIYCDNDSSGTGIINNIIAFNPGGINNRGVAPQLLNNCVYNPDAFNYSGINPGAGDISVDPVFTCLQYGEVHLRPDSPCIDHGNDNYGWANLVDMDGKARTSGSHVDMGADEYDGTTYTYNPTIVRVSPSGSDANDGSSWTLAKKTVQAGIDSVKATRGEVWVAAGMYSEQIALPDGVFLYGGFAGNETARSERNWKVNASVLNGDAVNSVVTAQYGGYRTLAIDGFTIQNGGNSGIYCNCSSPIIANNTITTNIAGDGGGINCTGASPYISNNVISNNTTNSSGMNPGRGGGIYCWDQSPVITNNLIVNNSALYAGAGIFCEGYCTARITNNTVVYNSAPTLGGIYFVGSAQLSNNIVAFNSSGIYGVSSNLKHNCVYGNTGGNYKNCTPGTTDISLDPLFVDKANGDYHLSSTSPCINAGDNTALGIADVDMDGRNRIEQGTIDIGADEHPLTINELTGSKSYENDVDIQFSGAVVTAAFDGFFYIESDNRETGIRVDKANHGLSAGQRADVVGVLATNADGERCITATSAVAADTGIVKPLALTCKALGGGDWLFNSDTGTGQQGIGGVFGLNNIGLLVRLSGGFIKTSDTTFTIDDGSGAVKCVVPAGVTLNPDWKYVTVTGISSCEKVNGSIQRLLRVREQNDIVPKLLQ